MWAKTALFLVWGSSDLFFVGRRTDLFCLGPGIVVDLVLVCASKLSFCIRSQNDLFSVTISPESVSRAGGKNWLEVCGGASKLT